MSDTKRSGSSLIRYFQFGRSASWRYLIVLVTLVSGTSVFAEDYNIIIDSLPTKGSGIFDAVTPADRFVVNLTRNHSYCCSVTTARSDNKSGLPSPVFSSVKSVVSERAISFEANSAITPAVSFSPNRGGRACFTADGEHDFVIRTAPFLLSLSFLQESLDDLRVECNDTTLLGGFNTFSSNYLFLEILYSSELDNGNAGRVVSVSGLNGEGSALFSIETLVNTRKDVAIHSLVGPNSIGQIRVNHSAPFGTITAYVAEYRIDSVSGGFALVGRQQLVSPRNNR